LVEIKLMLVQNVWVLRIKNLATAS
jgi:hypothetical protein